ncbi:tRNA lysidine(34) synthetase TilS [Oceanithermus sp.]|uniref:tRNA lysidine(34) synthetase TilS n=1 Tax=Oceanithermus sp. TaxID=2268145 RepID=UPI00338E4FEB
MNELERRFRARLEALCPGEEPVVAAVSGGGDSVALLHLLAGVGRPVVVAHLDHALRPGSAEDARFVAELAGRLGFPCELRRIDVRAVAQRKRQNLEAVARELRYAFLAEVARKHGAACVLTAHTLEDNAETVLLQLFRGAGRALGIRARQGRVVRPLLEVARAELRSFLQARGADWLEDPSNELVCLDRNYLRHEVWPRVSARFPRAGQALLRYAESQQADDAALDPLARARVVPDRRFAPVFALRAAPLVRAPAALRRRALRWVLERRGLRPERRYLELAERALAGESVSLGSFVLRLSAGGVVWVPRRPELLTAASTPPGLALRTARPGDRVRAGKIRKRLVDFLAERGVPPELRRVWPVAEREGEVVWVWRFLPEDEDRRWMRRALTLAREAAGRGEVPIGAVLVRGGEVLGASANAVEVRADATAHAELLALRAAQERTGEKVLPGATLYVTLEPCPMCMGAVIEAQLERVVWATENPKAGAVTRYGMDVPLQLEGGRLARESAMLLKGFFADLREPKT